MPTPFARTALNGGLPNGSSQLELCSGSAGTHGVDFPTRTSGDPRGTTSPEERIAAARCG